VGKTAFKPKKENIYEMDKTLLETFIYGIMTAHFA
jgi:hypothetical protein